MTAPLVSFVIGGVQKGGTTALASFLQRHPGVELPRNKEAHVFDAPDFDPAWGVGAINTRYLGHFDSVGESVLVGDATPIYLFHPAVVSRIARYNARMKWIIILRHPVERAVSQYQMEKARGDESWPFWPAMLLERWRLRGCMDDFSAGSSMRCHSYLARGDYARQLDVLYAHFPAEQVLLLQNRDLANKPDQIMRQVWDFLGLDPLQEVGPYERVFEGGYNRLPRRSFRFKLLSLLMARPMRKARSRYGLDWK